MILNDNSTQQINTLVIQLQNKITNLTNEFRKLNNNINDLNSEISDLERRVSSNENDADKNIDGLDSKISDLEKRVSSNENEAAAMNTEILANTEAISGKADKIHTHTKSEITDFPTSLKNPNALTVNGKTYDGSTAVEAGVQTVANGGTGVTTQAEINKAFIGNLDIDNSDVTDSTELVSSYASDNGFSDTNAINKPYKRKFSTVWNYIKGKISNSLEVFIKSKTVVVGSITIPSDNYLEIDVGLTSSDTVISAKLSSWSVNTGVFSIICYAKNRVFIVGDAGTTITNVSVQAIYI